MKREILTMNDISKHRPVLYGFAALWILLFHMQFSVPETIWFVPLKVVKELGVAGVEIFVLLTGVGLSHSLDKNPNVMLFLKKRFQRVFLPAAIVALIYYGMETGSVLRYGFQATFLGFWFGIGTIWYVPFILSMYLVYPLLHRLRKESPRILYALFVISLAVMFVTSPMQNAWALNCNRAICRIPVFILSVMLVPYFEQKRGIPLWVAPTALIGGICIWGIGQVFEVDGYFIRTLFFTGLASFLIIGITWLCRWACANKTKFAVGFIYRFFAFCGGISLEIYLFYDRVMKYLKKSAIYRSGEISLLKVELLGVVITLILSVLLSWFCARVSEQFSKVRMPD